MVTGAGHLRWEGTPREVKALSGEMLLLVDISNMFLIFDREVFLAVEQQVKCGF